MYTASTDQTILAVDCASGKAQARKKDAHDAAINRLACTGPTGLASGAYPAHVRSLCQLHSGWPVGAGGRRRGSLLVHAEMRMHRLQPAWRSFDGSLVLPTLQATMRAW